jgi:superfamily II DNA or RNA helicase
MIAIKDNEKNKKYLKKLTLYPKTGIGYSPPLSNYRLENDKIIIPRFFAFKEFNLPIQPIKHDPINFNFTGNLRTYQINITDSILEKFKTFPSCILNAFTGCGKTICALYIISVLKCKTLIIVNKLNLIDQFESEIKQFLPGTSIGKIQGKTFEVGDITIASLQTISKGFTRKQFKQFDFVIMDEIHNFASKIFSNAMFLISSHYRLGLSATVKRADEMEKLFIQHLGEVFIHEGGLKIDPIIHVHNIPLPSITTELTSIGKTNMAKLTTDISLDVSVNELIVKFIREFLLEPRRNILVLTNRVLQCKVLKKMLNNDDDIGLFIGGMKQEELKKSFEKRVIIATFSIAKEGFSLKKLNTLMLCSSVKTIEQSVGRILRQKHDIDPIILDMKFNIGVLTAQFYGRNRFYRSKGYRVIHKDKKDKKIKKETTEFKFLEED